MCFTLHYSLLDNENMGTILAQRIRNTNMHATLAKDSCNAVGMMCFIFSEASAQGICKCAKLSQTFCKEKKCLKIEIESYAVN